MHITTLIINHIIELSERNSPKFIKSLSMLTAHIIYTATSVACHVIN